VLAYGQTGSGKTYTMGSGFDLPDTSETPIGIIPRWGLYTIIRSIDAFVDTAVEFLIGCHFPGRLHNSFRR